ncbi:T9SS type A sorting domain-containing protein [Flavobacteriaceae bacterium 144Ye]|nr:T9SS type A sorting domain-containing protein [Flavobacteriaceae bacterium 144Ye]
MKKTTLALIAFLSLTVCAFSQTYSTGMMELSTTPGLEYSAQIDVTTDEVTLTLIGPSDRWLGLGFDAVSMTSGRDVVIFDGTDLTDRHFGYPGQPNDEPAIGFTPTLDERQDWTIMSNNVTSGVRTLVATRDRDTGNVNDYVFTTSTSSINLVWARGFESSFVLDYHGFSNRGITMESFTLSNEEVVATEFSIAPNPAKSRFNISVPRMDGVVKMEVFDVLGKKIYTKELNQLSTTIDISKWNSGVYLVRLATKNNISTKRFVKQ